MFTRFSLTTLRVSITGARLSHLVQKDKIWDHGSMVEQVKTIFIHLRKALVRNDAELVRKCMTAAGYNRVKAMLESGKENNLINSELLAVKIIGVTPAKKGQPDKFSVLLELKKAPGNPSKTNNLLYSRHWHFQRQRGWWLLHEIQSYKQSLLKFML